MTADRRDEVARHFRAEAGYWEHVYEGTEADAAVYRDRQARVLELIDALALPAEARALDAGCGAGHLSVALAERGFRVCAVDTVDEMIELTRQRALAGGQAARVETLLADAASLDFEPASFDLVTALGLLPWLAVPEAAVLELARVTRPGGFVILTADNESRLARLLDPRQHPGLAPIRRTLKQMLGRRGPASPDLHHLMRPRELDALVADSGLVRRSALTVGFAPLSIWGHPVAGRRAGTLLHRALQAAADARVPLIRSVGAHYVLLAQKPG